MAERIAILGCGKIGEAGSPKVQVAYALDFRRRGTDAIVRALPGPVL